ncbi:MAG: UDP-N-acetylglucosamine 2-epimerase (non-hydrolyzing) [Tannerellaceae bacterium]|jgi:UDP-GlcNAc3NAcA epimerase|nr:UDP-N-acetylglucosamine 2-epimerase (non-hydrolyzing) [Tannerellaceae bacterium]
MKKLITIVGARPQFVKAAMVSRAIEAGNASGEHTMQELILHTGQHYDACMSDIFFADLHLPAPAWRLNCSATTHGSMTGRMLEAIEEILIGEKPDAVIVYGDTNSTLAGAMAAAKLRIPVVHIEAGLRSFNRAMPEEINRVLTDHLAGLLCCPTRLAVKNLAQEGITDAVHHVGDVMYDAALLFGALAASRSDVPERLGLPPGSYRLCTVHRAENTDSPERLAAIFRALMAVASGDCPIVVPLHPRTESRLKSFGMYDGIMRAADRIRIIPPAGFIDMAALEMNALTILTDSGGVQKEAYFHRTPCITLRNETEWTETVEAGWNIIAGHDTDSIIAAVAGSSHTQRKDIEEYGDGHAAEAIVALL